MAQVVIHPDLTSSKTGNFYFAYGSNLSPTQMSIRLSSQPQSSIPIAIARLEAHAWIICQRGYANVVALPASNSADEKNTVWGVLYNLAAEDEAQLDLYEGHDRSRNPNPEINPDVQGQIMAPYLQGNWDYNKHYLPVTIIKWLKDPNSYGLDLPNWNTETYNHATVRSLVYVDELRTKPGEINQEYIGRMNRAIRESIDLGLSQSWVNRVLREYVPEGVEVLHNQYVGAPMGYLETETSETAEQFKERMERESLLQDKQSQ